jgi:hypothetical protein
MIEMTKITTTLPPFGKRVLFRGVISWNSRKSSYFFDDELTTDEEGLDYGISAYILNDNSDYLVSQHPDISEVCDEFVTHWCEIPEEYL